MIYGLIGDRHGVPTTVIIIAALVLLTLPLSLVLRSVRPLAEPK